MYKKKTSSKKMVATESKVVLCSTPEHQLDSPSRDSDSLCDSDAASPVPFLCTQDGAEGETDVVWNYYTTPRLDHRANSRFKNSTPLSRKSEKSKKIKLETHIPKRRAKPTQSKTELLQDLIELNQNLHELIGKNTQKIDNKQHSTSEDDVFSDSPDVSPKSGLRVNSRSLRKNLLSSKFSKAEVDTALESDDSMNECLLKASQAVEENLFDYEPTPAKRNRREHVSSVKPCRPDFSMQIGHDSMDAILNDMKLGSSPLVKKSNMNSSCLNNDTFDSLVGNLNDSALERLTQLPVSNDLSDSRRKSKSRNAAADWTVKEVVIHDGSPLSKSFGRHNSMPESPSVTDMNKPSTSGMVFGRYSSMPIEKDPDINEGDSPMKCTPEEIKKKHQQAREKLLAKRLLPFTAQQSLKSEPLNKPKKTQFQMKVPSNKSSKEFPVDSNSIQPSCPISQTQSGDLKSLIEKKRQEALNRLKRKQTQNKTS